MSDVQLRPYAPEWLAAYQAMARQTFQPPVYQAQSTFLRWLYEENPYAPHGHTDLTLAVTATNQLIGCLHTMWIPWRLGSETRPVPTLSNLMVLPAQRRQGIGRALLAHQFRRQPYVLIANAAPGTDKICRDFKCQPLAAPPPAPTPQTGGSQLALAAATSGALGPHGYFASDAEANAMGRVPADRPP